MIEEAPLLPTRQKRDIYYDNAARFLRLTPEQIAAITDGAAPDLPTLSRASTCRADPIDLQAEPLRGRRLWGEAVSCAQITTKSVLVRLSPAESVANCTAAPAPLPSASK